MTEVDPATLVSIVMPVYNAEAYLEEALASVVGQTYPHLDIVVVDDGSTDGSAAIIDRFAAADPRVRVLRTPNRGLVAALNLAIGEARGELLARMDADDICAPHRTAHQVAHMALHPECVAVGAGIVQIAPDGQPLAEQAGERPDHNLPDRCRGFRRFPPAPPTLVHPTAMIRREAMRRAGGYRPFFRWGAEDRDLWWRLSCLGLLHALPERLLSYRVHPANRSHVHQARATADMLVADLSAAARHFGRDDTALLDAYAHDQDVPATVAGYETLLAPAYPAWSLYAYRVLHRRAWALAEPPDPRAFRLRASLRALTSLTQRPSWYVLAACLR